MHIICNFLYFCKEGDHQLKLQFHVFPCKKECGTSAHTLKEKKEIKSIKWSMWFTFLKKPFPRIVHATYHQATNLPNLEMRRLMLDYRKRKGGCSISKQYRRAQLYHWQSCKMQWTFSKPQVPGKKILPLNLSADLFSQQVLWVDFSMLLFSDCVYR